MPATCGVAIDVPVMIAAPLPWATPAEPMFVPGAATSGLMTPLLPCWPREVESLTWSLLPVSARAAPIHSGASLTFAPPAWTAGLILSTDFLPMSRPGILALPAMAEGSTV